jgi:chromosomal replication initiator protein
VNKFLNTVAAMTPDSEATLLWNRFITAVETIAPSKNLNKIWFRKLTPVEFDGRILTVKAPPTVFTDYLMNTHGDLIQCAMQQAVGQDSELQIIQPDQADPAPQEGLHEAMERMSTTPASQPYRTNLNPRYHFDNYIEGESNRFALAAARSIADTPNTTPFNPFFVYGGSGFGKTHLIQAIGNHCLQQGSLRRVLYVTSEQFVNQFISSIKNKRTTDFAHLYRNVDMLVLDDIQFFRGKERTLIEFFHTFNTLYQSGKQIILSSDRPPKDLEDLDERLTSRFSSGLVTELTLPDYETRVAILEKRAEEHRVSLTPEVIELLAQNVTTNVRDLEGALLQMIGQSSLLKSPITIELTRQVIKNVIPLRRSQVSMETIAETCAEFFNIPLQDLKDRSRKREVAQARQVAMFICNRLTRHSLRGIALHFGRRDHSTVIHAVKTVEDMLNRDTVFRSEIEDMMRDLGLRS